MKNNYKRNRSIISITIVLTLAALACGVNLANPIGESPDVAWTMEALATEMSASSIAGVSPEAGAGETPETAVESCTPMHTTTPPEPPQNRESGMVDRDDTVLASAHRANSGENFDWNIYERPFTSDVMEYLPDIDIIDAQLSRSGDWVFVTIKLSGQNTAGGMHGAYGIEVDNNGEGRGDFIIYGINPTGTQWTSSGVKAFQDVNKDVGGETPLESDVTPGNGFETLVFDEGCINDPDAAWVRISPASANTVQLAFKWTLIANRGVYMWGAWAGVTDMLNPAWFDYNDHFTHAIAGSSLTELPEYYPLKEFWGWDNTCRWIVGKQVPLGTEPGLCPFTPAEDAPMCIPGITNPLGCK